MISQVHKDFPVYVISNDDPLSTEEKAIIVDMADESYRAHISKPGFEPTSFPISNKSDAPFLNNLYNAFIKKLNDYIPITINNQAFTVIKNYDTIYISYTTKDYTFCKYDCNGRGIYHNHKHNLSLFGQPVAWSIIYYLYVTNQEGGNIDFRKEIVQYPDGATTNTMEEIVYHKNNAQVKDFMADKVTFIQEAISYQPKQGDIVILPQTIDHRVAHFSDQGKRIALVLQLPTIETEEEILKNLEGLIKENEKTT